MTVPEVVREPAAGAATLATATSSLPAPDSERRSTVAGPSRPAEGAARARGASVAVRATDRHPGMGSDARRGRPGRGGGAWPRSIRGQAAPKTVNAGRRAAATSWHVGWLASRLPRSLRDLR